MSSGELRAGKSDLQAVEWDLEALSDAGEEVGHWQRSIELDQGLVTHVDLSEDGAVHALLEISGGAGDVEPQFAELYAPGAAQWRPRWRYLAPVFDGTANLHGVPPGPAVVRVLWGVTEVAKAVVQVERGVDTQRLGIEIPAAQIEVVHPGLDSNDVEWRLLRRLGATGSAADWEESRGAVPGDGESRFVGCDPGEYRLWMFEQGACRRFGVQVEGAVATVDARRGRVPTGAVAVVRGQGLDPGKPVEVEVRPGAWHPLRLDGTTLRLSHGRHRLRCALEGLVHAVRDVVVPEDVRVAFGQPSAPRDVAVFCKGVDEELWLQVVRLESDHADPALPAATEQYQVLRLDADGRGTLRVRPGRVQISDRSGRTATLEILPDTASLEFILR